MYQVPFAGVSNSTTRTNSVILEKVAGRTMTFGSWVYNNGDASSNQIAVFISDSERGYSTSHHDASDYHSGSAGWEWLECTFTFGASPASATVGFFIDNGSEVAYFSQPMLVWGNSIGSGNYTRPNQEVIHLEGECALTDLNASSFSTGTGSFNLEVESRGKLPKGLKAIVNARCTANDSGSSGSNVIGYLYPGSGYENGVAFDIGSDGLTLANDDQYKFNMPYMKTVDAGMTYNFTASGSSTLDLDIWVRAVEI